MNLKKLKEYVQTVKLKHLDYEYFYRFWKEGDYAIVEVYNNGEFVQIVKYRIPIPHYVYYAKCKEASKLSSAKVMAYALLQDEFDPKENAFSKLLSEATVEKFKEGL